MPPVIKYAAYFAVFLAAAMAIAQFPGRQFDRPRRGPWFGPRGRGYVSRDSYPTWEIDNDFKNDVFTFVRIQYDSYGPYGWWDRWDNDYPDSDWNFSLRLQQLTSLEVAPESKVVQLTDPRLFDFPFVYFAGVQYMSLSKDEQTAFRRYLLNGGFMMMDDFWTPEGLRNVWQEMRDVLPDSKPVELTLDHEIFRNVYELKELPQVVDIITWLNGYRYEHAHGGSGGDESPHFFGYFDNNERMVAILCHNNDIGDGWDTLI